MFQSIGRSQQAVNIDTMWHPVLR